MAKSNKNISFFNMIEVALAMAIIAFGMTSILGLFPVGLNACRNSIAENYSADVVEQFSSYLKGYAGSSKANFETIFGTSAGTGYYNTTTNPMSDVATATAAKAAAKDFLNAIIAGTPYVATPIYSGWTIFPYDGGTPPTRKNIYFSVMGPGNYLNPTGAVFPSTDFTGMILVWKSPLVFYYPKADGSGWDTYTDSTYSLGAGLNIEISWPLEVEDYNARQKRTFYIEMTKPQQ